jgi:peptidylprolyl isomerase
LVLAAGLAACASAQSPAPATAPAQTRSMSEIIEQAPSADWRALDPNNVLYMELPQGRVIIELTSDFAPLHTENVRALARAGYWDGGAVLRVQDNFVVQWGRPEGDTHDFGSAQHDIATPEYDRPIGDLPFTRLQDPDSYASETGFTNGFPAGRGDGLTWPLHCYGMIGVGRENPPNTGNSTELYAVLGQAPRNLDRNLAMVGRIVQGMELLSALRRGTGALGFYETAPERTAIRSVRLAADVPEAQRANLEAMRTDSASFRELIQSRRYRRDEFYAFPVGRINVCNVPLPVRVRPSGS